jgi:hydroxymethylpyrimidine/phosphomethylpyrimidine kinase
MTVNSTSIPPPAKLLTIAGSDSGGAAGLQADLRTWAVLGAYGMSVVTAVTAQNSLAVYAIQAMPPDFIAAQLEAVLSDYGANAAKTGFLGRVDVVETVAFHLRQFFLPHLVIDPVLVNHRGESMFPPAVTQAYLDYLFPLAALITPNRAEATLLLDMPVNTLADGETAVRRLHDLGPKNVLLKRLPHEDRFVDLFFDGAQIVRLETAVLPTHNTHGAGDTLSAAVCAFLARGESMETAVRRAHHFTAAAIQNAAPWQFSAGHGPVWPTGEK